MADLVYNSFKRDIMNGAIDLSGNTIKIMLVSASYSANTGHAVRSAVSAEVAGTGYSAGGKALANLSVSVDAADNEGVFDADDVTFTATTITARGAVIYKDTGNASTDNLIGYVDFLSSVASTNGDFTITWNSEGILNAN